MICSDQKWKLGLLEPFTFSSAYHCPYPSLSFCSFSSFQPLKALICSQCWSMSLAMHWALLTLHPATQWWGPTTRVPLGTLSTTVWDGRIWSTSPSSTVDRPFSRICVESQNGPLSDLICWLTVHMVCGQMLTEERQSFLSFYYY